MKIIKGLKEMYKKMSWYNRQKLVEANKTEIGRPGIVQNYWKTVKEWLVKLWTKLFSK